MNGTVIGVHQQATPISIVTICYPEFGTVDHIVVAIRFCKSFNLKNKVNGNIGI